MQLLNKLNKVFIKRPNRKIRLLLNKTGNKHKCYICGNTFHYFSKYNGGSKNTPEFRKKLDLVGSDIDNFGCKFCFANDRVRHLFLFFDKIELFKKIPDFRILHFGPEPHLSKKISSLNPVEYIQADLYPRWEKSVKMDATNIPHQDNYFDLLICNHILEHIPDYKKAMQEIFRVIKPNGIAILQTPYSKLLHNNFEDKNIKTDALRNYFHGENDHYRIFSERHFFSDLKKTGFNLEIVKNSTFFNEKESYYFGINPKEDLIQVIKPKN